MLPTKIAVHTRPPLYNTDPLLPPISNLVVLAVQTLLTNQVSSGARPELKSLAMTGWQEMLPSCFLTGHLAICLFGPDHHSLHRSCCKDMDVS